jgi:hypothetical protein
VLIAMSQQPAIGDIVAKFRRDYWAGTSTQVKILDSFLVYVLLTGLLQIAYCAVVGTFPFNSFLSGLFSTIGVFVLTGERAAVLALAHVGLSQPANATPGRP